MERGLVGQAFVTGDLSCMGAGMGSCMPSGGVGTKTYSDNWDQRQLPPLPDLVVDLKNVHLYLHLKKGEFQGARFQ